MKTSHQVAPLAKSSKVLIRGSIWWVICFCIIAFSPFLKPRSQVFRHQKYLFLEVILYTKNYYFLHRKTCFQGFKSGLNVIVQKQMTHQIDPLIKNLIVLSTSATWWPVYMPKESKDHIRNSRIYAFSIFSKIRKNTRLDFKYVKY